MSWTELSFGKHKGKTLPQVLFSDPDWFFWAVDEKTVFRAPFVEEAQELHRKATHIKIRQEAPEELLAEYVIHPSGAFTDLNFVPSSRPRHEGGSRTLRKNCIDLSLPRQFKGYDKLGCKMLVGALKHHYFGDSGYKMTRKRCEEFFDEDDNFLP